MGMRASFLAKTAPGEEGSSGHVHLSCWQGETNAFAGRRPRRPAPRGVRVGRRRRPRAPRRRPRCSSTRPSTRTSGSSPDGSRRSTRPGASRTAPARCARSARPGPSCWRFECRRPGADANPYLALAAIVASAADGIRRGDHPPARSTATRTRSELPSCPRRSRRPSAAFQADGVLRRGRWGRPSATTTRRLGHGSSRPGGRPSRTGSASATSEPCSGRPRYVKARRPVRVSPITRVWISSVPS